jgi:2-polyprenyl-3-methyl-5-hydroxy-6-metoxy-1,4-benzoquinol methylase
MNDQFNELEYILANPDVAEAVKSGQFSSGLEHYHQFGKKEGRVLNRFGHMTREDKALYAINKNGLGLEIGPSHNPIAPKRKGFNVHILDHASAEELKAKYQGHNLNLDNIEDVDFVWSGQSYLDLIGKTACYDWIIASHLIEHVPDLISFLQQCETLLKEDGVLSLIIPDKRYCFDYFSPPSSTGNILDAWVEKRTKPSQGQIFDYIANATKCNGNIAWDIVEQTGEYTLIHTLEQAKNLSIYYNSANDYMDIHCWRFTPASFRLILSDLRELNLINLYTKAEFDTTGCEFYVSLSKTPANLELEQQDRLSMLQKWKMENT